MRKIFHAAAGTLLALSVHAADDATLEVVLSGVDGALRETLLESLALARNRGRERLTPAFVKTLYDRAEPELLDALRAQGYYGASITAALIELESGWRAELHVVPGAPVLVESVALTFSGDGASEARLLARAREFPLQRGDRLRHADHELGKKTVRNAALELGYLEGDWSTHRVTVDPSAARADIELVFDTGPRYRFGTVDLPETVIPRALLERLMPFRSGEPYSVDLLLAFQQKLRDSNYFREVEVVPDHSAVADRAIPVRVQLAPNPRNSYRVGFGFGTDTGPRLAAGWESRYFGARGHRAEARLRLAPVTSSLSGGYLMPNFRGGAAELGVTALLLREDTDTTESSTFQSGLRRLAARRGWSEALSLNYRFEDFDVGGDRGADHLLMPGVSYWRSRSDDPIYPRSGYHLNLDLRGAVAALLSDVSFLQAHLRGKYIHPIGERSRLIIRSELGATAVGGVGELPATLRFFAGGDRSVRGFDFKELGPRADDGEVTGGRYLAVASVEYEQHVRGNWSAALFSDAGNAFEDFGDRFAYSIGAGLRWRSPIGLVGLDLAAGISESDPPIRLHFVVGPEL